MTTRLVIRPDDSTKVRPRAGRARLAALATTAALAVTGCSALGLGPSWAVTYEVDVVSGGEDAEVQVEYLTRETGRSAPQTTVATIPPGQAPLRAEAIGPTDEEVSVSAAGVPGAVLRCAVVLDQDRVIAEQESTAPGEGVDCTVTTPASPDD